VKKNLLNKFPKPSRFRKLSQESIVLEEYDKKLSLEKVMQEFAQAGYSEAFLKDLHRGLATSSIYNTK
jgi:hypothetical protein